ncbi:MAG: MopE-related protein, partial [Flavobacteriales bacterium]
ASIMYGELYYGKISKSTNGGSSFSQIVGSGGTGVNEDGAWVTPYVLGPNPNHIFVGKSLVFKSLDGGATFTGSAAFGGTSDCNYIAVAPSNSNIVYASKGSALYKSVDNAATFTQVNGMQGSYITSFCIHNTDPNKVWVSYSNYTAGQKIYFTADGGVTWTNISGSLPNLPANVVVIQPNTSNGIYVGMDAGVYFRDDVLGNFVPYFNALPNAEVFDLDVQLSTNTITACTYGRGIWRAPLYVLPALDGVMSSIKSPTGTLCSSTVTPVIQILNAGTTTLTSMNISYQYSGQASQNYNWSGSLATGASQNITLPSSNSGYGASTFSANIVSVNGQTDENTANNSLTSNYYCVNGVNNATLTLETDCYPGETSWLIRDGSNNIVHSGAGYASETTVTIPVCLATECYTFVINDSYGDGISGSGCAQGAGNYFIKDNPSQTTLVTMTNASFGTSASHNFCYPIGQVLGCTNPSACNYNSLATQNDNSCTFGPVNDLCSGAIALTVNAAATSGSNVSACLQGSNPTCGGTTQIKDVWYKFVFQGGPVTITTNFTGGTLSDTRLAVYSACGGSQIACNDDISSSNYKSSITLTCAQLTLGQTYLIQAGGYNASTGTFFLQVTAPVETCNGADDNCNGQIDEGFDADGDGYTTCGGDCNDNNSAIRPNATETCNGIDDNCNSSIDEGVLTTFYQDSDGDGYGNASVTTTACSAPTGYVSN